MPVMTTRFSWGSNVSSCDDICSVDRRGPRALGLWSCLDVGTRAMTPAAQAIWRNIRPMLNEGFLTSLAASLELHQLDLYALVAATSAKLNRWVC